MDPVSDIAFFVLLAARGSLARSAQELGVTPSTVSKRLAALERRLGVQLMARTTRRVSLTPEGSAYAADGKRLIDELSQLEQRLSEAVHKPGGLLRVHASLGFGRRHVAPAVSRFMQSNPDVDVMLHLSDRHPGLDDDDFDVVVRVGELPDVRLTARRLAANRRILCASPKYLARAGTPAAPQELHRHQCIVIRESDEIYGTWHLRHGQRTETVKVNGRCASNDGEAAMGWCLDGHGIMLRSEWDAAAYLRSGRLQTVLPGWTFPMADIYAVYPTRRNLAAKTRAFIDYLADQYADKRPARAAKTPTW